MGKIYIKKLKNIIKCVVQKFSTLNNIIFFSYEIYQINPIEKKKSSEKFSMTPPFDYKKEITYYIVKHNTCILVLVF